MTPEAARDDLIHLDDFEVGDVYKTCRQALETIANMKAEAQYHRNYDTGRYERHTRAVGEWVKDV